MSRVIPFPSPLERRGREDRERFAAEALIIAALMRRPEAAQSLGLQPQEMRFWGRHLAAILCGATDPMTAWVDHGQEVAEDLYDAHVDPYGDAAAESLDGLVRVLRDIIRRRDFSTQAKRLSEKRVNSGKLFSTVGKTR